MCPADGVDDGDPGAKLEIVFVFRVLRPTCGAAPEVVVRESSPNAQGNETNQIHVERPSMLDRGGDLSVIVGLHDIRKSEVVRHVLFFEARQRILNSLAIRLRVMMSTLKAPEMCRTIRFTSDHFSTGARGTDVHIGEKVRRRISDPAQKCGCAASHFGPGCCNSAQCRGPTGVRVARRSCGSPCLGEVGGEPAWRPPRARGGSNRGGFHAQAARRAGRGAGCGSMLAVSGPRSCSACLLQVCRPRER